MTDIYEKITTVASEIYTTNLTINFTIWIAMILLIFISIGLMLHIINTCHDNYNDYDKYDDYFD